MEKSSVSYSTIYIFLKKVGWKGMIEGMDSVIYRLNSLARLNVADGMATPSAQEDLLNMVEMAFRAYDPCFACATHSLPGRMPLEVITRIVILMETSFSG